MFIAQGVSAIRSPGSGGMFDISLLVELRSLLNTDSYKHSAPTERTQTSGV